MLNNRALESLHLAFGIHGIYYYLVLNYFNPLALLKLTCYAIIFMESTFFCVLIHASKIHHRLGLQQWVKELTHLKNCRLTTLQGCLDCDGPSDATAPGMLSWFPSSSNWSGLLLTCFTSGECILVRQSYIPEDSLLRWRNSEPTECLTGHIPGTHRLF